MLPVDSSTFIFMLYSWTDGTCLQICVPSQLRGVRISKAMYGFQYEFHCPLTELDLPLCFGLLALRKCYEGVFI